MEFTETLEKFRSLGGVVDNIELRVGKRGRGLFSINPNLPVVIYTPEHLLISPDWIYLDKNNQIKLYPKSMLNADIVNFYEEYQRFIGWGAGGFDHIKHHQRELQSLPDRLKNFLLLFGWPESFMQNLTPEYCLYKYFISRQIRIDSASKLMPIAELINHAPVGTQYIIERGVKLTGLFKNEVLASYHSNIDGFHFFINYHFPSLTKSALSCNVVINIPDHGSLHISRQDQLVEFRGKNRFPSVTKKNTEIHLSFLEIANKNSPALPRKTFISIMNVHNIPKNIATEIFDGLQEHNRQVLIDFIRECDHANKKITADLNIVATNQLAILN